MVITENNGFTGTIQPKLLRCFGWKDDYDGYFGEKNLNQKRNAVTVKAQTVGWWSFLLHGRKDE